jgi:hypothetical protein
VLALPIFPLAALAMDASPTEILGDLDRFDGQQVTVRGTITDVRELGNAAFSLRLGDGSRTIQILALGKPPCGDGATATVEGVFHKAKRDGYRIYSEVDATRVTCR